MILFSPKNDYTISFIDREINYGHLYRSIYFGLCFIRTT